MKKRLFSVVLVVVLAFVWCVPAFALTAEQITEIEDRVRELEAKYGINIRYDVDPDGTPSIGTGVLATFDSSLAKVTPEVVRQISSYWEGRVGSKITYRFMYTPYQFEYFEVLGSFDDSTAVIEIYMPSSATNTFITGDSPITFVHELGHAFHLMCIDKYGEAQLEREWLALNRGVGYSYSVYLYDFDRNTFVTDYAATSYHEDVAETFAHVFVRDKAGLGFSGRLSANGQSTALGDKVSYLQAMIPRYLTGTDAAVANYRKIYSTPVTLEWNGVKLSGDHLQFIDCNQPRYVLNGLLSDLRLTAESSTWVRAIGGWYVEATNNRAYLIFPGGLYVELDNKIALS